MRGVPLLAAVWLAWLTPAEAQVARLTTSDETILPDARTVFVQSSNLPGDGLLIVRSVRDGKVRPEVLGLTTVRAGESRDLRVSLKRRVEAGEALVVMLHADLGRRGVYDGDPVVLSVDVPEAVLRTALKAR